MCCQLLITFVTSQYLHQHYLILVIFLKICIFLAFYLIKITDWLFHIFIAMIFKILKIVMIRKNVRPYKSVPVSAETVSQYYNLYTKHWKGSNLTIHCLKLPGLLIKNFSSIFSKQLGLFYSYFSIIWNLIWRKFCNLF